MNEYDPMIPSEEERPMRLTEHVAAAAKAAAEAERRNKDVDEQKE